MVISGPAAPAQALQDVGIKDDHDGLDAGLWENITHYDQSISSSMKLDQSWYHSWSRCQNSWDEMPRMFTKFGFYHVSLFISQQEL